MKYDDVTELIIDLRGVAEDGNNITITSKLMLALVDLVELYSKAWLYSKNPEQVTQQSKEILKRLL